MPLNPPGISRTPLRRPHPQRPRVLGPPDVYPQDPNQKEDELNAVHVKQGFTQSHASLVTEEYGSLVSKTDLSTPVTNKVLADLKAIQIRKEDANTLGDTGRKRQSINTKDNFWLVVGKNKPAVDNWFRDLSNAHKPYSQLLRKVPIFNKKEEVLMTLCEHKVPTSRAVWYIKMSAAYTLAMSETNKTKKRQVPDPSLEWTHTLIRFLKEQLQEFINLHASSQSSSSMSVLEEIKPENSLGYKQWNYCLELCELMYFQGLLDRQEFLQWILELVEKCRYPDDPMMRIVMPLMSQYAKEFVQNELLSRKLAYQCAKKVTYLVNETEAMSQPQQNQQQHGANEQQHPVISAFLELTNDPYTRFIILGLASILQTIATECSTALVWHYFGENKTPSSLLGSPLDYLPNCAPSALPMPPNHNNQELRHRIRECEQFIKERSHAVEAKWSGDRTGQYSKTGALINTILSVLEDLDGYVFERLDSSANCLDSLYSRLFDPIPSGSGHDPLELAANDEAVVHTLCEWAVTSMRSGDHRAFVVAKLLERRQSEICGESEAFSSDDKDSDENQVSSSPTVFQSQLFQYLDSDSPTLENKVEFSHLVLLFFELICHDVFSHDSYLCQLISRGDLNSPMMDKGGKLSSNQESEHDKDDSFEESKIDGDLNNLLNQIKEGNQLEGPFSPPTSTSKEKSGGAGSGNDTFDISKCSRHWQYLYHFPLPQDDSSAHDCNQRHVLLYGVGKGRDDTTRQVKKLTKDVVKLFSKKFSIDVSDGGKVKKHSKSDFIFETVAQKFQNLPYFYQHCVSHTCGQTALDMLTAFTNCNANHLPVPEYISFLFDLSGLALNIQAIIDWSLQILKELPNVENQLAERSSCLTRTYTTTLGLYIVGVLRRYHTIFILNPSDVVFAFDQLSRIAYRPKLPVEGGDRRAMLDCNSAEWCILAYLYDLSCNCNLLRSREKFAELKRLFSSHCEPSNSTCNLSDKKFGVDYIANPKKKVDPLTIKLLIENPQNQYNLVCNFLMEVCECNDTDKLNDIAILCCEFTAQCNSLSAEWLGALTALCNAGGSNAYHDLLAQVSIEDQSIYNRLGIFVSILIARHCFQLQSFVISVAIPSLLKAWEDMKEDQSSREAEMGARLSCHLLLKLFKTVEAFQPMFYTMGSPSPMPRPSTHASGIKYSCDRHLLSSAHRNITVGAIIAVLKAILVLGDADKSSGKSSSHCDEDEFGLGISLSGGARIENASLSDFAKHTLKQICTQEWVHDRCLQVPDDLLKKGTLLDHMLTPKQAQKLLRLICIPSNNSRDVEVAEDGSNHKRIIARILDNLDEWNLRISAVDLKLMYHQMNSTSSSDVSSWLDNVSCAIVDVFQLVDKDDEKDNDGPPERKRSRMSAAAVATSTPTASATPTVAVVPATTGSSSSSSRKKKYSSVWMIPYLVKHLKFLQSRVLKVSGHVLERGNWSRSSRTRPLETTRMSLGHQPFLRLVLTCLKELDGDPKDKKDSSNKPDREEQKENLLQSLHTQLSTFLCFNKDEKLYNYEDPTARKAMQDALQLRFSLVGGLFDTICRSVTSITDWCTLLVQVIARGVVDLTNNSDLFTHVLDILTILIHSTLINDRENGQSSEENRKHYSYHTLVKKLKKEIGEKNSPSIHYLRQLLPFPKMQCEVIVTEPFGTVADAKGNKVKGLHSDKKQGLQVCDKQKISPWDLLEGHKNPAPLSWSWFGAIKYERKPMKYEEIFHELKYANFSHIEKPNEYYLEAPPLPQEELEPAHKDDKEEEKTFSNSDTNMMMMVRGGMQGGGPQANMSVMMNQGGGPMGNRNQPRMMAPTNIMGGPGGQMLSNPGGHPQMMYGQQGQPMKPQMQPMQPQQQQQPWGGYGSGQMAGASQQSMGYPAPPYGAPQQNMAPVSAMGQGGPMGPRFGVPSQSMSGGVVGGVPVNQVVNTPTNQPGNSKQALQNLLRTRGPSQYISNNSVVGANPAVGPSGGANMGNTIVGPQGTPFALPRQNYQARPTMRNTPYGGGSQMGGGMNVPQESMATPGQFTSMGGGGGPPQQQQQQFGNNFGAQQGMSGGGAYMMRQSQPGGYNQQPMMNRHQQPGIQQGIMGGGMGGGGGGYNMGGMNRMAGPGASGGSYMQSAPNVNMGNMQQQQQQAYRPVMNMQQQQQQQMMRMQTPQLMAQLQRGPQNMGPQQQMNYQQQQQRF